MKNFRFSLRTVPFALLAACLAAFGLLIPWLGFYQDDWYQVWFGRAFGTNIFVDYYAGERPFIALLYMLTTPLIGTAPLGWQVFGLLTRWFAALAVWWFLRLVWPRHSHQTGWAALLFALYPGFRIQYASVIYSHYFLQLAIQVLSLGSMLLAMRKARWYWPLTILSMLGSVFGLFSSEYFFGLELARPVFIWLELGAKELPLRERLKRTFIHWIPYLVLLAIFVIWRIFIFQFPTYQPFYFQNPAASPFQLLLGLVRTVGLSIVEMGLLAWVNIVRVIQGAATLKPANLAGVFLAFIFCLAIFFYLLHLEGQASDEEVIAKQPRSFAIPAMLVGLFLLFASGWPFWFVNLGVNTDINTGSRFGISFMLGSALLLVGLIDWLGKRFTLKVALVAVFAGLATGYHFQDADFYREVNRTQASFFQQLAWRAPGLRPGTLVLTNSFEEHVLSGDNSLTAALNWIYEPRPPYSLQYMLFYIPTRIQTGNLKGLGPGVPVEKVFRTALFTGSTDHALVIYYPYPQCLRVLDPQAHQDLPRPVEMPREIKEAIPISNLGQILTAADPPAVLDPALFKYRPDEKSWCYFYEKAELARQQGEWGKIVELADQALAKEKKFQTTWELLPFIEGYARGGQPEKARQLTMEVRRLNPDGRAVTSELLCSLWNRLGNEGDKDPGLVSLASGIRKELQCP